MLTNREIASLIIIVVAVALLLVFFPPVRKFLSDTARIVFGKQVLPILLLYLMYAFGIIALANWVGAWRLDLLKDTILVVILVGLPLLFRAANAKNGELLVRRTFKETLGVSVLLLFYVNLASSPIWVEVLLQLLIIFMATLQAVALNQPRFKQLADVLGWILAVIGFALFIFTTVNLIATWQQQDTSLIIRTLLLSAWYPFALLPFIYLVSFYAQAQLLFVHLPAFNDSKQLPLRVRLGIMLGFHGSTHLVSSFAGQWRVRAGKLRSFRKTQRLMKRYRTALRKGDAKRM